MKKVCFVCYHGFGTSVMQKHLFQDYLSANKIKGIEVLNSGVETSPGNSYNDEDICSADFVILSLCNENFLKAFSNYKPKGKIITMKNLYKEARKEDYDSLMCNKSSADRAFGLLVKKINAK